MKLNLFSLAAFLAAVSANASNNCALEAIKHHATVIPISNGLSSVALAVKIDVPSAVSEVDIGTWDESASHYEKITKIQAATESKTVELTLDNQDDKLDGTWLGFDSTLIDMSDFGSFGRFKSDYEFSASFQSGSFQTEISLLGTASKSDSGQVQVGLTFVRFCKE